MGRFFVLGNLIAQLFEALKAEGLGLKEILDDMLDVVEKRIADSPTKLDDKLIQPLAKLDVSRKAMRHKLAIWASKQLPPDHP